MIKVEKKRSRTYQVATTLIAFVATLTTFGCGDYSKVRNAPSKVAPEETLIREETFECVFPYENNTFSIVPYPIYVHGDGNFSKLLRPHILSGLIPKMAYNSATSSITSNPMSFISTIDTNTSSNSNQYSILETITADATKCLLDLYLERLSEQTIEVASKLMSNLIAYNDDEETEEMTGNIVSYYTGPTLTACAGTIEGPSGKETYYNLDMTGVVSIMRGIGNSDPYWVRDDGVKMLGDYVMIAANFNIRPRGSYVETSLGTGIVCDTGGFAETNEYQIDIATTW